MKRIVICADGTWNDRDQVHKQRGKRRPTNVTKIARAVLNEGADGIDQVVYYHDGIGTRGPLDRLTGGAFGKGMERNIQALYRFILYNYVDGDELFLFGFSRGAFTVRSLVGFMHLYGLVRKDDDYYVPEMYGCYERAVQPDSAEWKQTFVRPDGSHRIQTLRPCPPIRFLGVWDTVGALGAPGLLGRLFGRDRFRYHQVDVNPKVGTAVHAVAIDERRAPFDATLFTRPAGWHGTLHQAWFPGVHSNVGGGYDPDGLANEALHWVADHAAQAGLALDRTYLGKFEPHADSTLNDSLSWMYRLMGPIYRKVCPDARDTVHDSVYRRWNAVPGYRPPNLPPHLHPPAGADAASRR